MEKGDPYGYLKISRKFFEEDPYWNEKRPRTKAEAWLDLLFMASWKPRQFVINNHIESLQRGELFTSIRFLANRWHWGKNVTARWMEAVQKAGRLQVRRAGQAGTVYLLVNYEYYQGPLLETGTPEIKQSGTPTGRQRDKAEAGKQGSFNRPIASQSRNASAQPGKAVSQDDGFGSYIALVRHLWWQPDGKPPADWTEGREASVYQARRAKGETHIDLLAMVRGVRLLLDRGTISWVQGKPTSRLLNNTAEGARNLGTLALEAYQTHGEAPPRAIRTSTSGMTSIGSLLPAGLPVTSSSTTLGYR